MPGVPFPEKDQITRSIGKALKEFRLSSGLSQERLSYSAGVDRTYISNIELGERSPTILVLWRLAKALKIPPADFVLYVQKEVGFTLPASCRRKQRSNG